MTRHTTGSTMIETHGLTRHFTSGSGKDAEVVEAVRGIDLQVATGELVAILGPNGAGKSTTLRMLTTLLPPTAGTATVAGADITTDAAAVRRRIGYIGQGNGAGHSHRVDDELMMQGRFHGLDRRTARSRADELLAVLDLGGLTTRKVSALSGGQRRRLDIAMGLLHDPPLLFLDEPSTGMDPQNRANLWQHVQRVRQQHETTVVLTTHYLEEADTMAERVVVIDHGAVIADDTPGALKASLGGDALAVTVDAADRAAAEPVLTRHAVDGEVRVDQVAAGPRDGSDRDGAGRVRLTVRTAAGSARLPAVVTDLQAAGVTVRTAAVAEPTLDDVFLHLTGRSLREGDLS